LRIRLRNSSDSSLDLRMTVGAEQNTLLRFSECPLERTGHPAVGDRKGLLQRIHVVELKRPGIPVVAAEPALSARGTHERELDAATAGRNSGDSTAPTPVALPT